MQTITSKNTSINSKKAPAIYHMKTAMHYMAGRTVLDYGGGRYDTGIEAGKAIGATVTVYDPYNRTPAENAAAMAVDRYDVAVCSNVLNVINCPQARYEAIQAMHSKADVLLFTVYEGNKTCEGRVTAAGWQENRPTWDYIEEIRHALRNTRRRVWLSGKVIVADYAPDFN